MSSPTISSLISKVVSLGYTIDASSKTYLENLEDVTQLPQSLVDLSIVNDTKQATELYEQINPSISVECEVSSVSSNSSPETSDVETEETKDPEEYIRKDYCSVDDTIEGTYDENPLVRKAYLRDMCPCHVKRDVDRLWNRIMSMYNDPDPRVRYQVLHNLCDGSPTWREDDIIQTLESMHNDTDKKVRRQVHRVLTNYRRTGKWNIL
eukprot:TRINITY_DN2946_c0_g1_i1.p1 TRINITY_DN2946_c0_g1~~TRINITY_DN2946_c0_g1_i1.p1  ORF type:complete len:208 (-),score=21.33 TRINITY_DN2946_c0_g1_i1:125-748(-)